MSRPVSRRISVDTGHGLSQVTWKPEAQFTDRAQFEKFLSEAEKRVEGWDLLVDDDAMHITFEALPNLVVDSGVQRSLDRLFAINGPPAALVRLGVDNGASNPVAGTTQSGANTKTLLTFDSTPTRSSNVVTAPRTFTNSNVNFAMKRFFLSAHTADITNATTADTAGTMYSCTAVFTIDFTAISSWSLVVSATVTGAGT